MPLMNPQLASAIPGRSNQQMENKKIVITGGATEMPRATGLICARHGAKITISDINAAERESAVAQIRDAGGEAWFHQTGVSKDADVRSLMETVERDRGDINSLVSAAAIARDSLVPVDEFLNAT